MTLLCDPPPPAIELHRLTKWYGDALGVIDVDLRVERGELFGFIGPNGAGKTTTIRLMLDFIRPTSGSATVLGLDSSADAVRLKRHLGYLPGDLTLPGTITPRRLFAWFARLRECSTERAFEVAERLRLALDRPIDALSSGNRQKVGLVQALMHDPDLLILDEPTSGLDPLVQREFRRLVVEHRDRGATVFMSSHVLSQIEAVCDRVAMIVEGRVREVRGVGARGAPTHRVRVELSGPIDVDALASIDSVSSVEVDRLGEHATVAFHVVGDMDCVVKWAARHRVHDLTSGVESLDELFLDELTSRPEMTGAR